MQPSFCRWKKLSSFWTASTASKSSCPLLMYFNKSFPIFLVFFFKIGKTFLEALKSDKISLEEAFPIGMMVPFKVARPSVVQPPKSYLFFYFLEDVKIAEKGGKSHRTRPIVECAPGKLNAQYTMHPGLTIFGVVESLEEKGKFLKLKKKKTILKWCFWQ